MFSNIEVIVTQIVMTKCISLHHYHCQ